MKRTLHCSECGGNCEGCSPESWADIQGHLCRLWRKHADIGPSGITPAVATQASCS